MSSRRKKKHPSRRPGESKKLPARRDRWKPVAVVLASALGLAGVIGWLIAGDKSSPSPPLNLVLVSVDTLRADYLSCYGSRGRITPNIDRLADSGALFEQVATVAPTTLPAHASLFTGLTPLHHGVRDNVGFYLPDNFPTLASLLKQRGYRLAFSKVVRQFLLFLAFPLRWRRKKMHQQL